MKECGSSLFECLGKTKNNFHQDNHSAVGYSNQEPKKYGSEALAIHQPALQFSIK
jgi:hypothetical protein